MASQVHQDGSPATSAIEKTQESELSLEPNEHHTWKPDRKVKLALAVQTFCVVRRYHIVTDSKPRANAVEQFIISLDMTILTATLPVSAEVMEKRAGC